MNGDNRLLSCIGRTPMVRLHPEGWEAIGQVWCKLEFMNPGGSLKDRMCRAIVEDMEKSGQLSPGDRLVEASGGNTAVSLAMVASAKGYALSLVMPESVPSERRRLLAGYGAEIVLTPASNGMKGALNQANEIRDANDRTFMIDQFENPSNPGIHSSTTAVEIIADIGRIPDVFVAGVGTGGTLTGVGEAFRAGDPAVRIVAVEPSDSPILSGGNPGPHRIPGIGAGFIPKVLNTDIIDDVAVVEYEEAVRTVQWMAEKEGIFAGLSSGAAVSAALRRAERLDPESVVVTIACDTGERHICFAAFP
jgi:cysteine synthase